MKNTETRIKTAIHEAKAIGASNINDLNKIAEKHKILGLLKNDQESFIGWTAKIRVTA